MKRRNHVPLTPQVHRYLVQCICRGHLKLDQLAAIVGYELVARKYKSKRR